MIKVFGFPSFTTKKRQSGVDYVRMVLPMTELKKQDGFKVDIFTPDREEMVWDKTAEKFDVFYFNYLNNPWGFATMGAMARKNGVKLIMDLDDNIWNILSDNKAYGVWKPGGKPIRELTAIANEVDHITCTNRYLRNAIIANTDKKIEDITILPNRIDIDSVYTWRKPFKEELSITIGHFGSTTHFHSLQEEEFVKGMNKLMREYPNVKFRTIGAFIPKFREMWGRRYEEKAGSPDLMTWIKERAPEVLADVDFLAVPLNNNVYNRSKSSIKFLEASSMMIPGCYQNIRQYKKVINHGVNGMLCESARDWYKSMKTLIDNPPLRKNIAKAAYETVEKDWQMKDHVQEYVDMFEKVV